MKFTKCKKKIAYMYNFFYIIIYKKLSNFIKYGFVYASKLTITKPWIFFSFFF